MDVVEKKEIVHEVDQYPHDCDYYSGYHRGRHYGDWGGYWNGDRFASKGLAGM